jgi:hypothetical protein
MGKTRRFALTLGLSLALCNSAGLAFAAPDDDDEAADDKDQNKASVSSEARPERTPAAEQSPEERLAQRRERLLSGAQRLRERAAEMRKKAAAGETPAANPNAKRPPRSYAEQAQRLEEQAGKMEERSKTLDLNTESARSGERTASSRARRHQVRRVQLNRRWGDTLKDPEAISELKLHAERTAKLKRIRAVALKKSKDDPIAERASQLLAKEVARHESHMKELQAKSVASSVANAPAATTPAPTPAAPSETTPAAEATK